MRNLTLFCLLCSPILQNCSSKTSDATESGSTTASPTAENNAAGPTDSNAPTSTGTSRLVVVNGGDGTVSSIDPDTHTVASTFTLTGATFPHHVSVSPDDNTLMVAVPGMDFSQGHNMGMDGMHPGAVYRLDAHSGAVLTTRKLPQMNHNVAWAPDGKSVWTSQMMMSGTVLVLDATTLETTATIAVGDMPEEVSFSVDGKLGFVANEMANSVTIIDAATHKVLKTLAVAGGPVGAWQGWDNQMYVDSEQGKTITVISAAAQSITATIQLNFTPGMAALAKDGKLWVTNTDAGAVALFDPKTGKLVKSIPTGAGAHGVLIDPIQMRAYVTNQGAASISVIDMMSLSVIASVQVGNKPNGLALVPK